MQFLINLQNIHAKKLERIFTNHKARKITKIFLLGISLIQSEAVIRLPQTENHKYP